MTSVTQIKSQILTPSQQDEWCGADSLPAVDAGHWSGNDE